MNRDMYLNRALLEIYSELDRDRLMALVVRYARDQLGARGSSIFLRDDITGRYVLRGTTGLLKSADMPSERVEYEPGEGLTGWIAKHGRSLRITNVRDKEELRRIADDLAWGKKYSEISAKPGLAYLGVPILSREEDVVLGVLRVSGKKNGGLFDERDEALLSDIAAIVNIAIENSQRYEREKRRARYFRLLLDISSDLDPRRPIPDILHLVTDQVRHGFRTEGCLIYLQTEEDGRRVELRAVSGLPEDLTGELTYMRGEGLTGHIFQTGDPVQIREAAALEQWHDPHIPQVASHLPSHAYRSFIGVPLRLGSDVHGTLELINKIPSGPGHRDWFTDDDEEYLLLLSTAISGVLEGARYLKTLNEVGVSAMRMQRIASFGTLAQRIRHEAANPLAVARLGVKNLRNDLQNRPQTPTDQEFIRATTGGSPLLERRLGVIEDNLDLVSGKLLDLLKFSQRIGFVRSTTQWNDVVREVLIWLSAERQRRGVELHVSYGELPKMFIEPNELFGVLATALRLAMEALDVSGGLIEIGTELSTDGQRVHTEIHAPKAPQADEVSCILEPDPGAPEELSPLHFEWALAQETVRVQYGGDLTWKVQGNDVYFRLELPLEQN